MASQGQKTFLYDWFPTLNFLLEETDAWKQDFSGEASASYLAACCEAAWLKCEKYFKLADNTPILYAAVIMDPTLKQQWFIEQWADGTLEQKGWILQVQEQVRDVWRSEYKQQRELLNESPPLAGSTSTSYENTVFDRLASAKRLKGSPCSSRDRRAGGISSNGRRTPCERPAI
jgi:hypothetical protein